MAELSLSRSAMRRATIWSVGISTHHNNSLGETSLPRPAGTRAILLPLAFTLGLAGLLVLAPLRHNPKVVTTFLCAAAVLFAWNLALFVRSRRNGRTFALEVVLIYFVARLTVRVLF